MSDHIQRLADLIEAEMKYQALSAQLENAIGMPDLEGSKFHSDLEKDLDRVNELLESATRKRAAYEVALSKLGLIVGPAGVNIPSEDDE